MTRTEYKCTECEKIMYFEGICYGCRQRKIREEYQAMPEASIPAKIDAIIAAMDNDFYKKDEYNDFFGLLAYRGISTENIAKAAVKAEVYYPWEMYRDATPEVRASLIGLLMQPECPQANHILQCLAIAGGEDVLAAFVELEKHPKPWVKKLYVPLSVYAQSGGWTFDEKGKRIKLNYDKCYCALPVSDGRPLSGALQVGAKADTALLAATPREDVCHHCGTNLVDILTLNGKDERLEFLKFSGTVKVPICPLCATMCERTVVRYTPDGESTMELVGPFGDGGKMPESEYAAMTSKTFALGKRPEPLFFAHGNDEVVTIGGFANWVQDSQYDACPDCGKIMKYFASVPWGALSDYSEGTLYLEKCHGCRIISAFHQQT